MEITYDAAKNERNIAERGLSFDRAADFDLAGAVVLIDDRKEYGETRYRAFGMLDGRMHAMAFVETEGGIRVISLRRANKREVKRYGK
jgi:uncharacterized DUF497 family protein